LAEEPWVPQLSGETRSSELAPALSRFAHLGERAQARSEVASPETQSPPPIYAETGDRRADTANHRADATNHRADTANHRADTASHRADATENKKVSFWRRIALPRPDLRSDLRPDPHPGPPTLSLESLLERIHALESQSAVYQAHNEERLARSEQALREIHEHDRDVSLNALRERLAGLEIDQTEGEEALRRATRGLKILGTLLVVALASGVGALVFLSL
jgi:hypothetical protein